jgi:hypothetical protein
MPLTSAHRAFGQPLSLIAAFCVASAGCAGPSASAPLSVAPRSDAIIKAIAPYATASPKAVLPASRADQLRAVSHVVRHWFGRYRARYSDDVRIETLIPHIDRPTWADVFVVATFADAGSVDSHGRPILARPKEGRYYRSVQLELRDGRWHIESVIPQ